MDYRKKKVIVWFRNDLRIHDNEALVEAMTHADEVLPVYIFDERIFKGKTKFGFQKTGKFRTKFIIESVAELRNNLQTIGLNLLVDIGKPEEIIPALAREVGSNWVYCNRERTQEEVDVQDAMENNLWSIGIELRYCRGKMLYYTSDLPFPVTHTPDIFTHFRKEVEKYVPIRQPLDLPKGGYQLVSDEIDYGELPSLECFGHEPFIHNDAGGFEWIGGENEAKRQLHYYLWETDLVATYKETRNQLLGRDFSSKLSPWLSQGCLSPKYVYAELKKYERERIKNKSTYWLFFELLWRDFFRLIGKKYRNQIFKKAGTQQDGSPEWSEDRSVFNIWAEGRTGIPFIDANMRELNATGFMSNRGRQNVASFLVKDLKINWQLGAEYFESLLLDYDPCSNYGNWNYVAGVGSDPRENRYFNIISQAKRYDPEGAFVKYWIPELRDLPSSIVHTPDQMNHHHEQHTNDFALGKDYPVPMIKTKKWTR